MKIHHRSNIPVLVCVEESSDDDASRLCELLDITTVVIRLLG